MHTKFLTTMLMFSCTFFFAIGLQAQDATFNNVWVEHNTYEYSTVNQPVWNGFMWITAPQTTAVKGMKIHIDVDVFNAQGQNLTIAAFVCDEDEMPIKSLLSRYRTPDGQLTSQYKFIPRYESTSYPDGWLFLPYSAFSHQGYGNRIDCKLIVAVLDRYGNWIGQSDWYYFNLSK